MPKVARITISVEEALLRQFESLVAGGGYPTRSEAVKTLMRKALVDQEWQKGKDVAGAVAVVYDHHRGAIVKKLVNAQHDFGRLIVCTQHVHLDHDNCMEVIIVRGSSSRIRDLLARLKAIKGIKHSTLMMATTGGGVK
jgi:CopG family nickel-responsive transcriptional regulator